MRYKISGKYCCMANWIEIEKAAKKVIIFNFFTDEKIEISPRQYRYLHSLDGNHNPMRIKGFTWEECHELYTYFDEKWMLRNSGRKLKVREDETLYTICPFYHNYSDSLICKVYNGFIMVMWLPILLIGLGAFSYLMLSDIYFRLEDWLWLLEVILETLIAIVFHELSHAAACWAYGGTVYEFGFSCVRHIPGFYVMIDDRNVLKSREKIQIRAAGVEANFFIAGIALIWLTTNILGGHPAPNLSGLAWDIACANFTLGFFNLLPIKHFDGQCIIELLRGQKCTTK